MTSQEAKERMAEVKVQLILAHREQDWERAKELSQLKQKLKKTRYCEICGVLISTHAGTRFCKMHSNAHRFYKMTLPSQ